MLQTIVENRKTHLDSITYGETTPSTRSFENALRGTNRIIMECKAASPSKGSLTTNYQPGKLARIYSRYADAISVLCEPTYFNGHYHHLRTVAMSTHLPVLCKDFIVDEVQVRAARYFGADAILLMLSVLSDAQYRHLAEIARSLNLDVLTETATENEVRRAINLGAKIIGINNRNLHDLSIDLTRTNRLRTLIPADRIVVAESGISSVQDIRSTDANAFLVGSHLAQQPDVDMAIRKLIYGENKVCGLTTPEAAQAARAAGAVYGGLIFEPSSPRYVSRETAENIMAAEPDLNYIAVTRSTVPIDLPVQQHGDGPADWRVVNPETDPIPDGQLVLDTGGGTGKTFDWNTIPKHALSRSLLAGGLNLFNLTDALNVRTRGLDLNSGVETNGEKDPTKLAHAFDIIRNHKND